MDILTLVIGLLIGVILGYLLKMVTLKKEIVDDTSYLEKIQQLDKERSILEDRLEKAKEVFSQQKNELEIEREKVEKLTSETASFQANNNHLSEQLQTQKKDLEDLQKKFTTEFENIAHKILKQNSNQFAESNQKQIQTILDPLKEKIVGFEKSVEEKYINETKDRVVLKEQIKHLMDLNQTISTDAKNLTKALKGESKTQGNWGELILERVLESSGLVKGKEYETQTSAQNIDGKRIQPDVIVHLPENKHIIVDSKVSLTAYENYTSTEEETDKQTYLKNHLLSIRTHIKSLSEKNYQTSVDFNTPDFVLLFLPIESSFSVALQTDSDLYNFAWDKKIVIVSPTTLLATLKTISSIWKQERQTRNAIEIADRAGKLYDKFVGFLEDMEKIQKGIESSQKAYENAYNKLSSGAGNLIGRTEKIRKLGAAATKKIDNKYLDSDEDISE